MYIFVLELRQDKMTQVKEISIKQYLSAIGIKAQRDCGYYGLYLAYWRGDKQPSVKVDYNKNVFIDYGTGKGGSIIDLVMVMDGVDAITAINKLKGNNYDSYIKTKTNQLKTEKKMKVQNVKELSNYYLMQYFVKRGIRPEIYNKYCVEVEYTNDLKPYYGVGFKNDSDGYVIRTEYFKGCTSSDATTIAGKTNTLTVIEGFMDFLSLVQLYGEPKGTVVVLNSLTNINKVELQFKYFDNVCLLLDNDTEGDKETLRLLKQYKNSTDYRNLYKGHKDLNEYLNNK